MDRKILERCASFYNKQNGQKYPCSNQNVICGIITNDRNKALTVMENKGAIIKYQNTHQIRWMLDNEEWIWMSWNERSKGRRLYKVIVDENIDEDVFRVIFTPFFHHYCCSFEII